MSSFRYCTSGVLFLVVVVLQAIAITAIGAPGDDHQGKIYADMDVNEMRAELEHKSRNESASETFLASTANASLPLPVPGRPVKGRKHAKGIGSVPGGSGRTRHKDIPLLCPERKPHGPFTKRDVDLINVALNVEYLSAEFFLYGAYGHGVDKYDNTLSKDGPRPFGGERADLGRSLATQVAKEIGFQGMEHIRQVDTRDWSNNRALAMNYRTIQRALGESAIPRPQLNISKGVWAKLFSDALQTELDPPFNPYNDTVSFLLAAGVVPYAALMGYFGQTPHLYGREAKKLVAGLLSVISAQDAILRTLLSNYRRTVVQPYNLTVADIRAKISAYTANLTGTVHDIGAPVSVYDGLERKPVSSIVAVTGADSLPFSVSSKQLLGLFYATGNASVPGAFFPYGAAGKIADMFLRS